MPDIDRTVDIKVNADRGMVTAEIPLAGTPASTGGSCSAGWRRPNRGRRPQLVGAAARVAASPGVTVL
jgi:hypothetical protein